MKRILFFLLAFMIVSCNQNPNKEYLLGVWDIVSSTDIETGQVDFSENDNKEFVEFKSDSIYLISDVGSDTVFAWRSVGDSIFLDEYFSIYIKELTKNKLTVEYDFLGKNQITLKKRK